MSHVTEKSLKESLDPEKVAYWYFRLNGFFQMENFVIHAEKCGPQRTDADLLAVRFPFRAERLIDDPDDIMDDDEKQLALSNKLIDIVIAEVKTNQRCTLNGPWTRKDRRNVHRVLAAIGCFPPDWIAGAADDIYDVGFHQGDNPTDEVEAMLATQMAAIHQSTMMMAKRLNHVENIPQQDSAERALNKLARTYSTQMDTLKRYRAKAQQTVRVECVTVNEGGQAIVGSVATGGRAADEM